MLATASKKKAIKFKSSRDWLVLTKVLANWQDFLLLKLLMSYTLESKPKSETILSLEKYR